VVDNDAPGSANDAIGADDDNGDVENGMPSRLIRAASHLPLWGAENTVKRLTLVVMR